MERLAKGLLRTLINYGRINFLTLASGQVYFLIQLVEMGLCHFFQFLQKEKEMSPIGLRVTIMNLSSH
jgi:hypothetical protein